MSIPSVTGYRSLHNPRTVWRGGGIGVLLKDTVRINNRDFKIVDNGRLERLDAYTGDFGRVR